MTTRILGYGIRNVRYFADEEPNLVGTATVHLRGWNHETWIDVKFTAQDSRTFIVCRAAARSGIDWKWPWWRLSANRKLAYLKKNKRTPQLWLEEPPRMEQPSKQALDEGMEGV